MSKKILIVRLDRIGDVALSTPVIKALRDAHPDSYIAMMVLPYAREIVEGNPYLDEVIIYDKGRGHKGVVGNYKFVRELKKKKFDIAIILHPTARTHMALMFAGIPERIGYDKKAGFLLTKRIPHTKQFGMKHEIDYSLDILKYIGIKPSARELCMPINSVSERKIEAMLKENNIKDSDIIVAVNPGASCASKCWNVEKFAKVSNRLTEKYGARIVVISGSADKVLGDKLASLITTGCVNLSGKTGIGDVASLLRRARLFISNDSGPVHIGCAVGVSVIAIFGRGDRGLSPKRWGPIGKHDAVLHKSAGCEICYAHNCKSAFKCLDSITPEEVLAAAEKILGSGKKQVETKETF
ncbi:MAG: lipopolysaccharide heptosyltransferase II [Candidatus Omnitrophica bacterium]|nr:lipopolysaccharide heptosyltransferase II [Candidatus Omnitrophota bacterium]